MEDYKEISLLIIERQMKKKDKKEIEDLIDKRIRKYLGILFFIGIGVFLLYIFVFGLIVTFNCEAVYRPLNNISNSEVLQGFVC